MFGRGACSLLSVKSWRYGTAGSWEPLVFGVCVYVCVCVCLGGGGVTTSVSDNVDESANLYTRASASGNAEGIMCTVTSFSSLCMSLYVQEIRVHLHP